MLFEHDKGNAGEVLASTQLSVIFDGECIRETMRGEGVAALDLQLKYQPSIEKTHNQIGVQVKTGPSFGSWVKTKNRWRIDNIDSVHIKKWQKSNQPVLLVWVRLDPSIELYWKVYFHKTPVNQVFIPKSHKLNPGSRFEIERLVKVNSIHYTPIPKITTKEYVDIKGVENGRRMN